jgi:hypothetical protein
MEWGEMSILHEIFLGFPIGSALLFTLLCVSSTVGAGVTIYVGASALLEGLSDRRIARLRRHAPD